MEDEGMKTKQAVNPYLPSWEYVPDAEPHIVDGRVYIYGCLLYTSPSPRD